MIIFASTLKDNRMNGMYTVRQAAPHEFAAAGELMVQVYSQLDGFPKETDQPAYYEMLRNVGALTVKPGVELLVAVAPEGRIEGAVVFFADMQYYGSGGTATREKQAAGFRLLAVNPLARGSGIGKLLTLSCIAKARKENLGQVVIHTTQAMQVAWKMYEKLGFVRSQDLDFMQAQLPVFGFRLNLV